MPSKPAQWCRWYGCKRKTTDKSGFCDQHHTAPQKRYDRNRKSSSARGYNHRWREYRAGYLMRNPLCVMCLVDGRTSAAEVVDHIQPVIDPDDPRFYDPANHQALCKSCHSIKTVNEDGGGWPGGINIISNINKL